MLQVELRRLRSEGRGERSGKEGKERKKKYDETQSTLIDGLLTF